MNKPQDPRGNVDSFICDSGYYEEQPSESDVPAWAVIGRSLAVMALWFAVAFALGRWSA